MKYVSLALSFLLLTSLAEASEFESRLAEKYRHDQEAAGQWDLIQFGKWSAENRDVISAYLLRSGGNPQEATCSASVYYDCSRRPCTPQGSTSLPLLELGAPGIGLNFCEFRLPGDRACRVERPHCVVGMLDEEKRDCHRAKFQVSCIDGQRRTSSEYIYRTAKSEPSRKARTREGRY